MIRKRLIAIALAGMIIAPSTSVFANEAGVKEYNTIYHRGKVTANSGLNVRKSPTVEDDNRVGALEKGEEIDILSKNDEWYKISHEEGLEQWVSSKYIEIQEKKVYVNASRLNFRKEGNLSAEIYKSLPRGTEIEFLEQQDEWIKVKYKEQEGYVHSNYIVESMPKVNNTQKSPVKTDINTNKETPKKEEVQSNNVSNNYVPQEAPKKEESNVGQSSSSSSYSVRDKIVSLAHEQLGKPYVWAAEGPHSFDCSGLIRYIYQNAANKSMPRVASGQATVGTTVSKDQLKPGDLIFSSTDGSGTVSHVGIYVGDGYMIHAPKPGDVVKKTNINTDYWNNAYLWSKNVLD